MNLHQPDTEDPSLIFHLCDPIPGLQRKKKKIKKKNLETQETVRC